MTTTTTAQIKYMLSLESMTKEQVKQANKLAKIKEANIDVEYSKEIKKLFYKISDIKRMLETKFENVTCSYDRFVKHKKNLQNMLNDCYEELAYKQAMEELVQEDIEPSVDNLLNNTSSEYSRRKKENKKVLSISERINKIRA